MAAHICQNYGMTPEQFRDMTPVEVALYSLNTTPEKTDGGVIIAQVEAMAKLTILQRAELNRRLYR